MTDFKAKMHQIQFRLGLRPRLGELTVLPRPPSWIWGPLRSRGKGWAGGEEGKGRERGGRGKRRGGKGRAPKLSVEPGPLRALLRHWAAATRSRAHSLYNCIVLWVCNHPITSTRFISVSSYYTEIHQQSVQISSSCRVPTCFPDLWSHPRL